MKTSVEALAPRGHASRQGRPAAPADEQTVLQLGRLIEHLRSQLAELDRRESLLNGQLSQLDNERRSLRLASQEFHQQAEARDASLTQRDEQLAAREAALAARAAEAEARERGLAKERSQLEAERSALRATLAGEFAAEREQLASWRKELEAQHERQQQLALDLEQQGVDLEKRSQFHSEHLTRLRRDIAAQQAELEHSRQAQHTWAVQVDDSIRFRLEHIRKFRDLLGQREAALEQEQAAFGRLRLKAESEFAAQRGALAAEHADRSEEVERRMADVARRQELLQLQAENLEARRTRLDQLRDDLDSRAQEMLETKAAVEQTFAQLAGSLGDDEAFDRTQQARSSLFEAYRDMRESLTQRRLELDEALRALLQRRDEFRGEREAAAEKLALREQLVQRSEHQERQREAQALEREARWQAAQAAWRTEQLEAGRVIRSLIDRLEARFWTEAPAALDPAPVTNDAKSLSPPGASEASLAAVASTAAPVGETFAAHFDAVLGEPLSAADAGGDEAPRTGEMSAAAPQDDGAHPAAA